MITFVESCDLPTRFATFRLHGFEETTPGGVKEHVVLTLGDWSDQAPILSRVHSECLTGDGLFSMRCDCGPQLEAALKAMAEAGRGALFYLRQEGRGIGLSNKIRAYKLQDEGADTVEANVALGFDADLRQYDIVADMAKHLALPSLNLLTNNPRKVEALETAGVKVNQRLQHYWGENPHNEAYLATKQTRMDHWLKD